MGVPTIVSCAKDTWTKVATNVVSATIWKHKMTFTYGRGTAFYQTYVATGGSAPTDLTDAHLISDDSYGFNESAYSDVYIYARYSAGEVRTDA